MKACRQNRFDRDPDLDSDVEVPLKCSDILNFNKVEIVNKIIFYYSVDELIKDKFDEKFEELQYILHTDDQDEIDLFLYDYYKKEIPQRFVYLA